MSYQVKTGDIAISNVLLEIAAENGWNIRGCGGNIYRPYLVFYPEPDGFVAWNEEICDEHQTTTIPEFIVFLKEKLLPVIKIGKWLVEFQDDGISVGCQFVDTATVDAIHERLHAND